MARPSKYDKSFLPKIIEMGKEGASKAEMSAKLGITRETFNQYEKEYPEFSDAVKQAVALSQAWWEEKGRQAVFNSTNFNATAYIFNMKNRFRDDWSDRIITEHAGSVSIEGLYGAIAGKTDGIPEV
jgi:DNA-binding XRE family transcriptional regulator